MVSPLHSERGVCCSELCCNSALPNPKPEEWKPWGCFLFPLGWSALSSINLSIERGKWQK